MLVEVVANGTKYVVISEGSVIAKRASQSAAQEAAAAFVAARGGGSIHLVGLTGVAKVVEVGPDIRQPNGSEFGSAVTQVGERTISRAAAEADKALGRVEPEGNAILEKVEAIEVNKILPARISDHPTVRLFNRHVSEAAAWFTLIALILGSGTVSAFMTSLMRASSGSATVGSYASVVGVFFATSAVCISGAVAVYYARSFRGVIPIGALGAWVIGVVALCPLLAKAGLAAPPPELLREWISAFPRNPISEPFAIVGAFIQYYGLPAFLTGCVVAYYAGSLVYRIEQADG